MARWLLPPFSRYTSNKPTFNKKERRHYIFLYDPKMKKVVGSISYARYLMSVKLGRLLDRYNEHVDHIDGDRTNDTYSNLVVITPEKNREKYHLDKKVLMVSFTCPSCKSLIVRRKRRNIAGIVQVCSARCRGILSTRLSNLSRDELHKINNVVEIAGNYSEKVPEKMLLEDFDTVSTTSNPELSSCDK